MGYNVRVMCKRLVNFCEDEEFVTSSRVPTRKRPRDKHMLEFEESLCQAGFRELLRDSGQVTSDSRNSLLGAF